MWSTKILQRAWMAALAVLVTGSLGCQRSAALQWGADEEGGAPYITKDANGRYQGFEVDLADALAKEMGRPIEFKQYEFTNLIQGLQRGDIDLAMNGLEVTPDRQTQVLFSRPYYIYRLQLVARRGDDRFQTIKDIQGRKGVKVGTLQNTAADRLLKRLGIPEKTYTDQVNPYRDLSLGRLDAVLLDLPVAIYVVRKNPELNSKLKFVGEPIEPGQYAIAFRKEDTALAEQVNKALDRLIQDGELQKIYEKWDLWNDDQKQLAALGEAPMIESGGEPTVLGWDFRPLLAGAGVTVLLSVLSMFLAVLLGLPIALARLFGPAPLRALALVYVEFFRGIPVLLLLYFLYYVLPAVADFYQFPWSLRLGPFAAALLGFGLNYAAYEAEIYRAGIRSIPPGQWEAAASLGMGPVLAFRRIILPQALRVILPPMTSDFVALFKDTSVASVITVVELQKQYQILVNNPENYPSALEIAAMTALLYLVMSIPLGHLSRRLEQRWGKAHE